jgi:hypothetical protein
MTRPTDAALVPHRDRVAPTGSRDDVGNIRVDDQLNLILQPKLAALEAGDFQLVADRLGAKCPDALIELAMLGLECFESLRRLIVIHRPRSTEGRVPSKPDCVGDDLRALIAEWCKGSRQTRRFVIYYGVVTSA